MNFVFTFLRYNEDMGDKLSRRDFLKLAGAALGGLALNPYLPKIDEPLPEKKFVGETIRVGNLELTPIITEHDKKTWEKDGDEILHTLENYPLVIPEYFPPDYEPNLKDNPIIDLAIDKATNYDSLNFAFTKIEEYAQKSDKIVCVVDPAYSDAFVKLRASKNWWMPLLGAISASPFAVQASEHIKKFNKSTPLKTVVSAVKTVSTSAMAISGVAAGTFFMGGDKDPMGVELDIRHVFIAESLVQLGEEVLQPTKTALIYPKGHWNGEQKEGMAYTKGILFYLQNPEEREKQFKKYCDQFSGKQTWEDFFKIRRYTPTQDGWKQEEATTLSTSGK